MVEKKGRSDEEIEELEGNGVVGCLLLPMAAPGKLEGDNRRGVGFESL